WMPRIAERHPAIVARVYRPAIEAEYKTQVPAQAREHFIDKLSRAAPQMRAVCLPVVLDVLKAEESGTPEVVEAAVTFVLASGASDVELEALFARRCHSSLGRSEQFAAWWCAWS